MGTVDRVQPRVRIFKLLQAGPDGFYFGTGTPKKGVHPGQGKPAGGSLLLLKKPQMMRVDGEMGYG